MECVDAADGKSEYENVDSYKKITKNSIDNADADLRTLLFSNLKRISGTKSRNQNKGKIFMDVCYC